MRNPLENYNETNNFWEYNPQYLSIEPFKSLHSKDRSKDKKDSSDKMWSIALIYHPDSDIYYTINKEEKVLSAKFGLTSKQSDDFIKKHKDVIDEFIEISCTQAQKSLISWDKRMKARDEFLTTQKYSFGYTDSEGNEFKDNTKALDEMQSRTGKMYEEFNKIKKELLEESVKNNNKGYSSKDVTI